MVKSSSLLMRCISWLALAKLKGQWMSTAETCIGQRAAALYWRHHLDEYRKHVEKDAALSRRFQPVYVGGQR